MVLKRILSVAMALVATPVFSQVQLFEAEVSGLVLPYVGVKWNSGITEFQSGLEYTIDGRTTLGFEYDLPLKDTLTFDPDLKAYTIHPYGIFEFIEPDNLKTFSFAIRADFIHEDTKAKPDATPDTLKYNNFSRTQLGGGPVFALRIFSSEKLVLVPAAGYEFFYVTYQRNQLIKAGQGGVFKEGTYLWHDVFGSIAIHLKFNERFGMTFEPKVTAKIGEGRKSSDLLNVSASTGLVLAF